jgi:hypothetical protein
VNWDDGPRSISNKYLFHTSLQSGRLWSLRFHSVEDGAEGSRLDQRIFLGAPGARAIVDAMNESTTPMLNIDRTTGRIQDEVPWLGAA